jgi:hypothetical protein
MKLHLKNQIQTALFVFILGFHFNMAHAQWVKVVNGVLPPNALVVGKIKVGKMYIARASIGGHVLIGKTIEGWKEAFIPYNGKEVKVSDYEVYTRINEVLDWVKSKPLFPKNAVQGGNLSDGSPLYVVRSSATGELSVGGVRKGDRAMIPWDGKENYVTDFEYLVITARIGGGALFEDCLGRPLEYFVTGSKTWDFETGNINGWQIIDGTAFNNQPKMGDLNVNRSENRKNWAQTVPLGGYYWRNLPLPSIRENWNNGRQGNYWIGTEGEGIGTILSPQFTLCDTRYLSFLISGTLGYVELLILQDGSIKIDTLEEYITIHDSRGDPNISLKITEQIVFGSNKYSTVAVRYGNNLYYSIGKELTSSKDFLKRSFIEIPFYAKKHLAVIAVVDVNRGYINVDDFQFHQNQREIPASPIDNSGIPLWGFVDMHAHPASQYGFGGQLMYGDLDGDPNSALGSCNCIHNFVPWPFDGNCGKQNKFRNVVVDKTDKQNGIEPEHNKTTPGFPNFPEWPRAKSIYHQQMYVDWIKRAWQGGLRVIVALAVNNHCLADIAETEIPNDDLASMNLQIQKIKEFVGRHDEVAEDGFMEIAKTSQDLRRIVNSGRLAVIIGVEMDNIGNFYSPADGKKASYNPNPSAAEIKSEIDRLYALDVRYIFPIHLTNNVFGGTAVYLPSMNVTNKYNTGRPFEIEVVGTDSTGIGGELVNPYLDLSAPKEIILGGTVAGAILSGGNVISGGLIGTGIGIATHAVFQFMIDNVIPGHIMPNNRSNYPEYPVGTDTTGHRNIQGLTALGDTAITYMMKKGMLIDIDHMSDKSTTTAIGIAKRYNYPINSGHNGPRGSSGNERGLANWHYKSIDTLGGMAGLGLGSDISFVNGCNELLSFKFMNNKQFAFGTDANGLEPLPTHTDIKIEYTPIGTLQPYQMQGSSKVWDYNKDSFAHYGMFPDFLEALDTAGIGKSNLRTIFMGAEYFAQMWEKCERQSLNVR